MESGEENSVICRYCRHTVDIKRDVLNNEETINKCSNWLDNCSLNDNASLYEESSYTETTTSEEDGLVKDNVIALRDDVMTENNNVISEIDNLINRKATHYENIQIHRSKNVHIGDVMHINGPVFINQMTPTIQQNIVINQTKRPIPNSKFFVVSRTMWLAQPPLDPADVKLLQQPVKYVVISHTASEESYTQTGNNLLVRLVQQLHVESKNWNDIGYNFLFGADGSIYEGRGWNIVGAHAFRYNQVSIGICFIGCYINKLPPEAVMKKAKDFIQYGVEIGAVAEDYRILAHCQCSSTESPGRRFFEEIKTWERWDGSVSFDNPSPLV